MLEGLLWVLLTALTIFSACHALLTKRDPRAGLIWILLCVFLPGGGALLYWLFGVNRIRTRAKDWQSRLDEPPWPNPNACLSRRRLYSCPHQQVTVGVDTHTFRANIGKKH